MRVRLFNQKDLSNWKHPNINNQTIYRYYFLIRKLIVTIRILPSHDNFCSEEF